MYERNFHWENLIVQLRQFAALLYTSSITKLVNFGKNKSQKMLLPEVTKLAKLLLVLSDCNGTRTHNHLVWLNGWMFVYELSGCGFEPRFSHLTSDFAPDSSKEFLGIQVTIVWIHSETRTWHDKEHTVLLVLPATNATSERSFSAMERIKAYLRSSTTNGNH